MPYQCRLVDDDPVHARKPGDMWFVPKMVDEEGLQHYRGFLSDEYMRDWYGKRPPIVVTLPSGSPMCVDHCYSDHFGKDGPKPGWTVTGEAPNITLSPSINSVGTYHGWLQNGVLTDDVEGRRFP